MIGHSNLLLLRIFFNMKHSFDRNVIEGAFGLLEEQWTILKGQSYYLIKIQCRIILACYLLHNLIRREMHVDPLEHVVLRDSDSDNEDEDMNGDCYTHIETSKCLDRLEGQLGKRNV
ncbi:hypothetical protein Ddye_015726 [Dipteronia dyeriana]|uniref:Nuclease HARBI1 n=1 Tax=Dipteronia dyeriana TaxID=168575 RepID=A0AAD9U5T9_9ROSI|nr:hypothetical protein Ddye_015726 [Dipteronia dyeriana]